MTGTHFLTQRRKGAETRDKKTRRQGDKEIGTVSFSCPFSPSPPLHFSASLRLRVKKPLVRRPRACARACRARLHPAAHPLRRACSRSQTPRPGACVRPV